MNLPKQQYTATFEFFWKNYFEGVQKGSKIEGFQEWLKLGINDYDAGFINGVIARQKKEAGWRDRIGIPHVCRYLKKRRFDDEPIIEAVEKVNTGWQKTDAGIMAKGKEIGLQPATGWTMQRYLSEITIKLNKGAQ